MTTEYWMVHRNDGKGYPMTDTFSTEASAREEAEMMAQYSHGIEHVVLKAVDAVKYADVNPQLTWTKCEGATP